MECNNCHRTNNRYYPKLGLCKNCYEHRRIYGTFKHSKLGQSKHVLYKVWTDMKSRCSRKGYKNFHRWGGRGIKVCDRWLEPKGQGFWNFLADMGPKPTPQHTLDRIDNDGNYEPDNCRWATWHEQARNKSDNNDVLGVSYSNSKQCWRAVLKVSGKVVLDVCSKDQQKVIAARKLAEASYGV